jgi:hypothetical protein
MNTLHNNKKIHNNNRTLKMMKNVTNKIDGCETKKVYKNVNRLTSLTFYHRTTYKIVTLWTLKKLKNPVNKSRQAALYGGI